MKLRIAQPMPHSTRANRFLRWSRNVFLVAGVLALGYAGFVLLHTKLYQAYQSRRFQQQLSSVRPAGAPTGGARPLVVVPIAPTPGETLGRIEIARLGVTAIVLEGVDDQTLRRAVGHIPGTSLPGEQGNLGIAGHRDTFFRALRNIHKDDEVTLTTLGGTYHYLVDSTHVVGPEDTQVLDDSSGMTLTLVTCYPFYFVGHAPKRFIVRAHEIPGENEMARHE